MQLLRHFNTKPFGANAKKRTTRPSPVSMTKPAEFQTPTSKAWATGYSAQKTSLGFVGRRCRNSTRLHKEPSRRAVFVFLGRGPFSRCKPLKKEDHTGQESILPKNDHSFRTFSLFSAATPKKDDDDHAPAAPSGHVQPHRRPARPAGPQRPAASERRKRSARPAGGGSLALAGFEPLGVFFGFWYLYINIYVYVFVVKENKTTIFAPVGGKARLFVR